MWRQIAHVSSVVASAAQGCNAEEEEARQYQGYIEKYMHVIQTTLYSETVLRFTRHLIDKGVDVALLAAGACVFFDLSFCGMKL